MTQRSVSRRVLLNATGVAAVLGAAAVLWRMNPGANSAPAPAGTFEVTKSDAEWKQILTAEQYRVLRHEGTETPYSSPLNEEHRKGTFACAGCDLALFASETKFDSGTGWPSFWQPLPNAVLETSDTSNFMVRTGVSCRRCGGHLGHVFNDGPKPTGLRYCMNGVAMKFKPA